MLYLSFPFLVLDFVKPRLQYPGLATHRTSSTLSNLFEPLRATSNLRTAFEDFERLKLPSATLKSRQQK